MELAKNMKTHSSQFGLCNEQQRLQSNMTAVCPRLFEILTTLTLGALRKKIALCQQHLKTSQKKKNNETSSSSCGQQCTMKCQEHNRSKKGTLREKKRSDVHEGSTRKNDICNRRQITPQGIYLHHRVYFIQKKNSRIKIQRHTQGLRMRLPRLCVCVITPDHDLICVLETPTEDFQTCVRQRGSCNIRDRQERHGGTAGSSTCFGHFLRHSAECRDRVEKLLVEQVSCCSATRRLRVARRGGAANTSRKDNQRRGQISTAGNPVWSNARQGQWQADRVWVRRRRRDKTRIWRQKNPQR